MHSSSNSYPNQESLSSTRLIDIDNVSEQVAAKLDFRVYATNNSGGNNTYCYFVSQQAARQFSEILRQAIREAKTSLASTSQSTQTNAKRCNQCGANNPPDNAFCGKCGSALTKKCSRCGTVNDSGFKFCGVCGTPLGNP
ncbi:MAG: zinc ribbon domain-containing protein [Chloroflexi bacterium]|nr:zinc ribbon domain-containing protein [Chloroflexota bacterium]